MTSWAAFESVQELLVTGFFGSEIIFSVAIVFAVFVVLMVKLDVKQAAVLILPLLGGLTVGGWLGANVWALNLLLMVVGLIYASVILRLTGNQ